MTLPYEDEAMYYDMGLRQYVLKQNYVLNNLYLDEHIETELRSNNRFDRLLYEVSDDIYRYIYRYTLKNQVEIKRYILAKKEEIRDLIKRAMLYQVRYYIRSGGGLLKDMPGVDLERSRVIDINHLRGERSIATQSIDILSEVPEVLYAGVLYHTIEIINDGTY